MNDISTEAQTSKHRLSNIFISRNPREPSKFACSSLFKIFAIG